MRQSVRPGAESPEAGGDEAYRVLPRQLRRLLSTLLYVVYRNYCCSYSDEDCEDLESAAWELFNIDLYAECEEG